MCVINCKDQIWVPKPKDGWTYAQKIQNNEFVESWLENWAKMSWTTNKVDSNDKNRKLDWFKLKKIVLGTVRGNQFLYISQNFDYKFDSWLLKWFSLDFLIPLSHCILLLLYSLPLSSLPSTCRPDGWCLILVSSVPFWNLYIITVKLKTTVQVLPPH